MNTFTLGELWENLDKIRELVRIGSKESFEEINQLLKKQNRFELMEILIGFNPTHTKKTLRQVSEEDMREKIVYEAICEYELMENGF